MLEKINDYFNHLGLWTESPDERSDGTLAVKIRGDWFLISEDYDIKPDADSSDGWLASSDIINFLWVRNEFPETIDYDREVSCYVYTDGKSVDNICKEIIDIIDGFLA